ncbi:MAG: glycosyltransferase family 39 protein [Ignavibacteria bacterium]
MPSYYSKIEEFINNGENFHKMIFFLVVFLCITKIPSIVSTDIQPWDEGMYATRVMSLHISGDFIDQSSHSIGRFYSGSHPPLLIWIGYLSTLIFGINSTALKIIPFIFSLLSVILIILIGKKFFDPKTALIAGMIFCSNIIFNVFSKRFQFDYPYTFFILWSFYLMFLYNDSLNKKYLFLSGISFGCCLMVKILVGFYIPLILTLSFFLIREKIRFRVIDIIYLTAIGIIIALPWHLHMLLKYGSEFTDYFLKFHIYDRAFKGVEMNEKGSGPLYYINYMMNIIPYSVVVFFGLIYDFRRFKELSWQKIFLWIWFITGLIIIAAFKTKLEVYVLLILTPGCLLISSYIPNMSKENLFTKSLILLATMFNIFWFATVSVRPELKLMIAQNIFFVFISVGVITALYFLCRYLANKIELKNTFYIFILFFFFSINIYYLFNIPVWENNFQITDVKEHIEKSGRKKIAYVATNYRHNPQFSFYFNGLDLGWENKTYEFVFIDTKDGLDEAKDQLKQLIKDRFEIIVEREGINRAVYPDTALFVPEDFKLALKTPGYILYEN